MPVRDDISRMTQSRAERVREDFIAQKKFQENRLKQLKARKERFVNSLDEQISKTVAEIDAITSVIYEIDQAHFSTEYDLTEEDIQKILNDPSIPF